MAFAGSTEERNVSFDQLISEFSSALSPFPSIGANISNLTTLMAGYTSKEEEWQRYAYADPSRGYTRNLVDSGDGLYNLLILVWSPGKGSPIHDHANSHCAMKILKGSLVETRYEWPNSNPTGSDKSSCPAIKSRSLFAQNEVTYISDDLGLHRIANPDAANVAVSLHLYTPPNAAKFGCHIFNEDTGESQHVSHCHFYSEYGVRVDS